MYLWMVVGLLTWSQAHSHWEPCKVQCDKNFRSNDMIMPEPLIIICKRGCDLFTAALLGSSQPPTSLFDQPPHPKVLSLQSNADLAKKMHEAKNKKMLMNFNVMQYQGIRHQLVHINLKKSQGMQIQSAVMTKKEETKKNDQLLHANQMNLNLKFLILQSISNTRKEDEEKKNNPLGVIDLKHSKENKTQSIFMEVFKPKVSISAKDPSYKTTVEPASQPVQDHPAEACKETTTAKGPKRMHKIKVNLYKTLTPVAVVKKENVKKESTMNERLEQAKHSCRHECVAVYEDAAEQEACVVGCHLQATTAFLNPSEVENKNEFKKPKGVIGIFQHVVFNIASHVGRLARITWSWAARSHHEKSQENTVQVYGSEDLTRRAQLPLFTVLRQSYNLPENPNRPEMKNVEMNDGFLHLQRSFDNDITSNRHQNLPDIITITKSESKHELHNVDHSFSEERKLTKTEDITITDRKESETKEAERQHQLDLLECISRKSGYPRWFVAVAIFLAAIVMLWLCFSLTAPPNDIKVVKTKLPENDGLLEEDDEDYDDDMLSCTDKKKLLALNDDVIKIRIENV